MQKRWIGITQRLIEHTQYAETRECLAIEWGKLFMQEALLKDFLPLPLSYEVDFSLYAPYVSGVIFSGGNDLSLFDQSTICTKRDRYEASIIEHAKQTQLPLLGICRGTQHIAAAFHSTLAPITHHTQPHNIHYHPNQSIHNVNSFHNYAIKELGDELIILATADDGSIEGFRHKNLPIYACMWHIERESICSPISQIFLRYFIESMKS